MWGIITAPGCPRVIVEAGAKQLADVAHEYCAASGKNTVVQQLVLRSHKELEQRRNHVAALRTLVHGLEAWAALYSRVRV